jgi:hypothetical protein
VAIVDSTNKLFGQLPIFWADQKKLVADCGNLKLTTKNFQSQKKKFKQSPIVWQ